jgi:hypothetical protein
VEPEAFFDGHPLGLAAYQAVHFLLDSVGPVDVRVGRSQVAFRRRRGFAFLWLPDRWLKHPAAEVVLSVALDHHDDSPRWKEISHPSRSVWMHHLEIHALDELDGEVLGWLREAFAGADQPRRSSGGRTCRNSR